MDQTNAIAALAPFLALAKSATSPRAAADLVIQATSAQGTYVFAELLAQKNIESIKNDPQYASHHRLLETFAWGTWETYHSASNLPELNDAQKLKLRLLSLITYASELNGDLSYATLCKRLQFESAIDLEHLVTTAIYYELVSASLDPSEQTVVINSVAPLRDLAPGSIQNMLADLDAWSQRCGSVLADLETEIARVKREAAKRAASQAKTERLVSKALEEKSTGSGSGPAQANGRKISNKREAKVDEEYDNDDPMDLDEQNGGPRKKSGGILDRLKGK